MRRIAPLVCSILGLLPLVLSVSARADKEVVAEPETVAPGKTVTLRWYFTGEKVVVSGGRFGKGLVVTGRTSITDTPQKTTRYTFAVDYYAKPNPPATTQETAQPTDNAKTEKPAPPKLIHVEYSVVAEVFIPAPMPTMTAYHDPHGWQINFVQGWKRDVSTPDVGDKGLMFFQKDDDSVERLAVAVMPANELSSGAMMEKVKADLPSHYTRLTVVDPQEITHANLPAHWLMFSGVADSHPELRTQSIVMAVVRDGRAYIISARTNASNFKARQAILEKMIKSFSFSSGHVEDFKPYIRRTRHDSNDEA
ncbi:MAG TPA: hypothetical protein VKU00_18295 [Chthonomonadaceae bacterium]|nr:hypothetical protein [Chthonomonadaceae bacterium]